VVIADLNPAVLNQYCKPVDQGGLDGLFGAGTLNWKPRLSMAPVSIDQTINGLRVQFQAASAWQAPQIQPFTWHKHGKGLAILLNMSLASARDTASEQTPFEPFILDLLSLGNVRPGVRVEGPRRDKMLLRLREKDGCTTIGLMVDMADVGTDATIQLPKPSYVYHADGKLIGHGDQVRLKIDAPFQLLCAFGQPQQPPSVKLDKDHLALGQSAAIDPQGLSLGGVYRIEMLGPDGNSMRRRMRVILGQGNAEQRTIRLAFNDAPGTYTLKITDVRTGLSEKVSFQAEQ
jgi:hypothetical protein